MMQDDVLSAIELITPEQAPALGPEASDEAEEAPPFDSARFLAWHMLTVALRKSAKSLSPGLYILQAPDDAWIPAIKQAMRDIYLGGQPRGRKPRLVGSGRPPLHLIDLPSKASAQQTEAVMNEVQTILETNETALIIAGSEAIVPVALRRTNDGMFVVPAPHRRWVVALIREIVPGTRRINFRGLTCEAITPAMLRLAYRRNTSATAFLGRLRALAAREPHRESGRKVELDRLHGVEEAKRWATDLKTDLARYHAGELAWSQLSCGLLLAGPPGTAKTTLAGAIASFCGLAFIPTSYAAWQRTGSGHLGEVTKAMAACFTEARARKPALLFIDELDSVGSRGEDGKRSDWWRAVINALLPLLDGNDDNEGVIFMAASNHPELIDPAILRSGRLEERIILRLPDTDALARIYRDQLEGELADGVDLTRIGRLSTGITGADVVKLCNTARRRARNAARSVTEEDLLAAISGGPFSRSPEWRRRIAIHEAGHAIIALLYQDLELEHATVVDRGNIGGGVSMAMRGDRAVTPAMFDAYLTAILAGRAAEEVLLGEISAGAGGHQGSDLSRATLLAAEAELSLGLHQQGLIWYAPQSAEQRAALFARRPDLEQAVRARLDRAYAQAVKLIRAKAPLVHRLAERLLVAKVLTGAEVAALVREVDGSEQPSVPDDAPSNEDRLH